MAFKTVKARAEYQVTELVNNLNQAATTQSEQKRDYFTAKAMYYAQRLNKTLNGARITATCVAVALCFSLASCGSSASTEAPATSTDAATVSTPTVDTTTAVATDSTAK